MALPLIKYLSRFALVGGLIAIVLIFAAPQWLSQKTGIPLWSQTTTSHNTSVTHSYADMLAATMPSVVSIYSQTYTPVASLELFQDPHYANLLEGQLLANNVDKIGLGSGVIVSPDGYILTNHHIIAQASRIQVKLSDGRSAAATVVGTDAATDLAVIKIDLDQLVAATAAIDATARIGDLVFAIGNPHGLGQSVSMGLISGTGRNRLGLNTFESFIQTDAAINTGNSGGALVNSKGELVAINSAHFYNSQTSLRSQGLGLAIPISIAANVLNHIVAHGQVVRGWLGIDFEAEALFDLASQAAHEFSPNLTKQGILLTGIYANSPAHQAGLQPGDRITHFDGRLIMDWNQSLDYVTNLAPGSKLSITYIPAAATIPTPAAIQTTATLGTRPSAQ